MRYRSNPSIRRMLVMALVCGGLVILPARAEAADLSEVGFGTDTLMIGILFEQEAGTYQQESQIADGRLSARLTFRLPTAPTTAQPGPVVVFWQLRIDVHDKLYGDSSQRLVGPPMVEAVLPDCDAAGACDLQVEVGGSITPALEAADLDWVSGARLYVAVTLARTYADGTLLQAVRPLLGNGGDGGTLAQPLTSTGGMTLSALIPADAAAAHHAEIPTEEFGIGGPPYDWGAAVAEALGMSTPSESASPSATSPSSPSASPSPNQDPTTTPSVAVAGLLMALVVAVMLLFVRAGRRRKGDSAAGPS
jgi:hypothetical protein